MIINQAYLFLIFILNGIIIGLLFDFFRILRRSFKTNNIITYIEDILFWILTGIILLYSIFTFNNGQIRLYLILGVMIGIISYILTISSILININVKIIKFIKKIIHKIISIILIPFNIICKIIKKILFKPILFFIINLRKISTNISHIFIKKVKNNKNIVKN